ncbi:MAG: hypothetical protein IPL86_16020 [Flavobacteriales bacterium]|nr:hypothetical protein [Flavobacteriales bacterium]
MSYPTDAFRQFCAEIAERDAQIIGLQNAVDACILQIERDQAELARLRAEMDRIAKLPTVTYLYKFPYLGGFVWRNSAQEFDGATAVDSMELIQRPEQVPAKVEK